MPRRAVALMTEYRRSYQPSQFRCATTTYYNNREFRIQQLQRFQNHSTDPFVWPDDDDDDEEWCADEVTTGCDEAAAGVGRARRALFEPAHQYRHRQLRDLYERRARSVEAQDADKQPQCNGGDRKDCSRSSHDSHGDSGCSSNSQDDDRSSSVHVVGPPQRDYCISCTESMYLVCCVNTSVFCINLVLAEWHMIVLHGWHCCAHVSKLGTHWEYGALSLYGFTWTTRGAW